MGVRVGVGVSVFALRGDAASVGGRASLAALLPHSPRLLLRRPCASSPSSGHNFIVVFAEAACPLSFDLLTWLSHGTLQLGAQLAILEGAHLWRHDL